MSEIEIEFNKDCQEKKMTGRSAFNAGKKQNCTLPSDTMSRREMQEMNGKLVSISLNEPMSWTKFKCLSRDLQETYINSLHSRYGCTYSDISRMFGLSATVFSRYAKTTGLKVFKSAKGSKISDVKGWNKFLGKAEVEAVPEPIPEPDPDLVKVMDEMTKGIDSPVPDMPQPAPSFTACSYDFEGLEGLEDIVRLIKKMPWKGDVKVHIEVSCGG